MVKISVLEPILELLQDKELQEKAEQAARFFFSNGNVTINLLPALFITLLTLFFILPLLGIPLLDILFPGSSAGAAAYSNVGYSGANSGYAGQSGYGYSARSSEVELTEEQRALYPELAGLRDKITELQDSEYNLRNQLYYNTGAAEVAAGTATNKISYTY